jgi:hypothetical protein
MGLAYFNVGTSKGGRIRTKDGRGTQTFSKLGGNATSTSTESN